MPSLFAAGLDCGRDLAFLLAVTEEPIFAGVGIDAADCDPWIRDPGADQGSMAARNGAFHQARLNLCDRVDQPHVRRYMDDAHLGRAQHH